MDGPHESDAGIEEDGGPPVELITASLPTVAYGLESGRVERVTSFDTVTPVPGSASAVDGVADIDGRVTVIVDAAMVLEGRERPAAETDELIVIDRDDGRPIGLRTPRGVGVETVPAARFVPPAESDAIASSDGRQRLESPDESLLRAVVEADSTSRPPRLVLDVDGIAAAVET
jgi:chemotaxis signal transduction protein